MTIEDAKERVGKAQATAETIQNLPDDVKFLIFGEVPNLFENLEVARDHEQQWAILYTQAVSFALSKGLWEELVAYLKAHGAKPFENKWAGITKED